MLCTFAKKAGSGERNVVGTTTKCAPLIISFKVADQIDKLSFFQTGILISSLFISTTPRVMNPDSIAQPIDRRVELIVTANGHH